MVRGFRNFVKQNRAFSAQIRDFAGRNREGRIKEAVIKYIRSRRITS